MQSCGANDLYKAGLENDDEVFTYLRDLRNNYKIVLYDDGFMSKLPKNRMGIKHKSEI